MGQDYLRRVDGYNSAFISNVQATIDSPNFVTNNAPAGPGRIEEIILTDENASTSQVSLATVKITIDGTIIYNNAIWTIWDDYIGGNIDGPNYSAYSWIVGGNPRTSWQMMLNLDYETSATVIYYPWAVAVRLMRITLLGRIGR
jgi:hypothetical protein